MEKPGARLVERRPPQGKPGGEFEGSRAASKDQKWLSPGCQEKRLSDERWVTVPQTDTGRRVEHTKAIERTLVKEFGKTGP